VDNIPWNEDTEEGPLEPMDDEIVWLRVIDYMFSLACPVPVRVARPCTPTKLDLFVLAGPTGNPILN
jgi:hypothetical protein